MISLPLDVRTAPLEALSSVDITAASFKANPFPFYTRLREEAPVFPIKIRLTGRAQRAWLVTRYDDVLHVLKNDALFVKDRRHAMSAEQLRQSPGVPGPFRALERNLLGLDGGDHDRLKALVHQAFTPRTVEMMRIQTQLVTDEALNQAERTGRLDLIADFAQPVPLTIIGRILGVPEQDSPKFARWTKAFVAIGGGGNSLLLLPSLFAFMTYLKRLIRERRAHPQDDLISGLIGAQEANDALSDDEVLAMVFLLLSAGHETTVNLIGSGTLALLEHPEQMNRLRSEPTLIKSGVEELVRYVVPAETATQRYAAQDTELAGTVIPKGELVIGVLASANRDPTQFERPDVLDVGRARNKHLSFGQGMHYCLGAPLSRMEAQTALSTLLARAPNLRLTIRPDQLQWRSSFVVRGLQALPVSL